MVAVITSAKTQLSKWKQQLLENAASLFESVDKHSDASTERIAQLEQLVGKLTLALEIQKKSIDFAELTPSEQRCLVETLRDGVFGCDRSVRRWGSTRERSIINRKATRVKTSCELK